MQRNINCCLTIILIIFLNLGNGVKAFAQLEKAGAHYKKLERKAKKSPQTIRFINEESTLVKDVSKLQQIILIRHGEPALNKKGWRNRKQAMDYVKAYDSVEVYTPSFNPLILESGEVKVIHTSTINRSISTAGQLFPGEEHKSDELYREFERKVFSFPNIKLPLKFWLIGSRFLWFTGLNSKGIERFSEAKERAKKGAVSLEEDAEQNGKALLVSHGLLNYYLVKYLKKRGWVEIYVGGSGYLSQKLLVRYVEND